MASHWSCVEEADDIDTCRNRVPSHFTVVEAVGDPDSLSGACFLCIRSLKDDKAHRNKKDRLCVVKVANGRTDINMDTMETISSQDNIRREIMNIQYMPAHPNFVRFFEASGPTEFANPYLAMEYVSGHTLTYLYEKKVQPSPALIWHVFRELINALFFLSFGLSPTDPDGAPQLQSSAHGDINGSNVMLDHSRRNADGLPGVVLIDFGLSSIVPLSNPHNLAPTTPDDLMHDVQCIMHIIHALCHTQEPYGAYGEFWTGVCKCKQPTYFELAPNNHNWLSKVFTDLMQVTSEGDPSERKDYLIGLADIASEGLRRAMALESMLKAKAGPVDADLLAQATGRPAHGGPVISAEQRVRPESAPVGKKRERAVDVPESGKKQRRSPLVRDKRLVAKNGVQGALDRRVTRAGNSYALRG